MVLVGFYAYSSVIWANKGAEYIETLNSSLQRHFLTVAEAVT